MFLRKYCSDPIPKLLDRQALANSADSGLIRVYTVCHFIGTFGTNFSMEKPLCLNFRGITENMSINFDGSL